MTTEMTQDPVRDLNLARKFIEDAMRTAGWSDEHFEDECLARLEKGMREYGEAQFVTCDKRPHIEASEEAADGLNWSMLEWQRDRIEGDLEGAEYLEAASAHFVLAYMMLRKYAQARR